MSVNHPLCCGFIKCMVYEQLTGSETLSAQYKQLKRVFPHLTISESSYKNRAGKVRENISKLNKADCAKKSLFIETFCQEKWASLLEGAKKKHGNLSLCKGCLNNDKYRLPLSYVPINSAEWHKIATENGLFRPARHNIIDETKRDINVLNGKYKEQFSVTFENALKMADKSTVQKRWSTVAQEVKENIQEQWKETAVVRYSNP